MTAQRAWTCPKCGIAYAAGVSRPRRVCVPPGDDFPVIEPHPALAVAGALLLAVMFVAVSWVLIRGPQAAASDTDRPDGSPGSTTAVGAP